MKRILTVLVLLVTVVLVSSSALASTVSGADASALLVPDYNTRSGSMDATLSGPGGDPDDMGTGNGIDGSDESSRRTPADAEGLDAVSTEYLMYLLSLLQLLAL